MQRTRRRRWSAKSYLYLIPGFALYAVFSLWPLLQTAQFSFYKWDVITLATWVGFARLRVGGAR